MAVVRQRQDVRDDARPASSAHITGEPPANMRDVGGLTFPHAHRYKPSATFDAGRLSCRDCAACDSERKHTERRRRQAARALLDARPTAAGAPGPASTGTHPGVQSAPYDPSPVPAATSEVDPLPVTARSTDAGSADPGWAEDHEFSTDGRTFTAVCTSTLPDRLVAGLPQHDPARAFVLKSMLFNHTSEARLLAIVGFDNITAADGAAFGTVVRACKTFFQVGAQHTAALPLVDVELLLGSQAFRTRGMGGRPEVPTASTVAAHANNLARVVWSMVKSAQGRTGLPASPDDVTANTIFDIAYRMLVEQPSFGTASLIREALMAVLVTVTGADRGQPVARVRGVTTARAVAAALLHAIKTAYAIDLGTNGRRSALWKHCATGGSSGGLRDLTAPSDLIELQSRFQDIHTALQALRRKEVGLVVSTFSAGVLRGLPSAFSFNGTRLAVPTLHRVALRAARGFVDATQAAIEELASHLSADALPVVFDWLTLNPLVRLSARNGDGRIDFTVAHSRHGSFTHDQLAADVVGALQSVTATHRRAFGRHVDTAAEHLFVLIRSLDPLTMRNAELQRTIAAGEMPRPPTRLTGL